MQQPVVRPQFVAKVFLLQSQVIGRDELAGIKPGTFRNALVTLRSATYRIGFHGFSSGEFLFALIATGE
jgi:hypothetical protein